MNPIRSSTNRTHGPLCGPHLLVTLALLILSAVSALAAPLRVGDALPAATAAQLNGPNIRLPRDLQGKVTILHFWVGGCSSCKEEMPAMEALHRQYARKGLAVLAVNVGQSRAMAQVSSQPLGLSYPILLDPEQKIANLYQVTGVPRTFILDRDGRLRFKLLGSASAATIRKMVLSLL